MTPSGSAENRKHPRMNRKVVLRVAPQGEEQTISKQWTLVTSKNISAGGVLFTYDRPLDTGTALQFNIHFPKKTIQCSGTVRRTNPSALEPLVNVAARLENLDRLDREFIEQFPA